MASSGNLNAKPPIINSRRRILSMLANMNVFENLLYFFSLALYNKLTRVRVIPAKSNRRKGQYDDKRPVVKYESAIPVKANATV